MSLGKRLFIGGAAAAAPSDTSDTLDVFGDGNCLALYTLDYDGSDTGGNYDGTPTDVTFGVDGQINWGADFNGSSSIIKDVLGNGFTYAAKTMTFSAWIFVEDASNDNMIIGDGLATSTGGWGISTGYGNAPNRSLAFSVASAAMSGVQQTYSSVSVSDNTWTHIVVSVDFSSITNSVKMYINGTEDTSITEGISGTTFVDNTTYNTAIGATWTGSAGRLFEGKIDQVRIFDRAISSTEVSTLYGETATVYTPTTDTNNYQDTITAYYKFDGNANDETTNYDGTESNITYEFGRFGTAAVFNGTSSYVSLTDIPSSVSADISISAWINTNTLSGDRTIISLRENRLIEISINSGYSAGQRLEYKFYDGVSNKVINLNENLITVGNWHHICLTAQAGGNMIAYFDGVAQGSPLAIGNVYANLQGDTIGAYISGSGGFFDGKIDQVRIYGLLLDATEVANLYNEKQAYITKNASDPFGDNSEVAFYELENNANDSTGSNDITSTNVTFTSGSGLFGTYAAGFNGSSQYITTGVDSSDISMTNTSFSCWVNFTATSGTIMDNGGAVSSGRGLVLETGSGYIVWQQANGTSGQSTAVTSASNSYNDGNWHHIVGTIDGSRVMKLYIDGNVESSTPTANSSATSPLYTLEIGRRAFYNSQYFNGSIDQVRIFDRALDGDEVFKLYAEVIN